VEIRAGGGEIDAPEGGGAGQLQQLEILRRSGQHLIEDAGRAIQILSPPDLFGERLYCWVQIRHDPAIIF